MKSRLLIYSTRKKPPPFWDFEYQIRLAAAQLTSVSDVLKCMSKTLNYFIMTLIIVVLTSRRRKNHEKWRCTDILLTGPVKNRQPNKCKFNVISARIDDSTSKLCPFDSHFSMGQLAFAGLQVLHIKDVMGQRNIRNDLVYLLGLRGPALYTYCALLGVEV